MLIKHLARSDGGDVRVTSWYAIPSTVVLTYHSTATLYSATVTLREYLTLCCVNISGFGGLGVACWPLVSKFAGSNPAEAVGFLGRKNPQHAFLRRGSKAVGPMS